MKTNLGEIIGILIALCLVIPLAVGVIYQSTQEQIYVVEYLEGQVIAKNASSYGTQVTLNNGGGLTIPAKDVELILGATYRFTFWNYDKGENGFWGESGVDYKGMELISLPGLECN